MRQPGSMQIAAIADISAMDASAPTLIPSAPPSGARLAFINGIRTSDPAAELAEVDLIYVESGKTFSTFDDGDLRVVWATFIDRPLPRSARSTPQVFDDGSRMMGPTKVTVRSEPGLYYEYQEATAGQSRRLRLWNILQWFEGPVYRAVIGFGQLSDLLEVADSLEAQ